MPDEPKVPGQVPAPSGQDPSGSGAPATDPGQDPKAGQDPKPTPAGQDPPSGLTLEATQAELAKVRREAAANRKAASEAEAKVKQFEDEKLSEAEKLQKKSAEDEARSKALETTLQTERLDRVAERVGVKANILDPEDASLLIDRKLVEFNDDGTPKIESVQAAVEELKARKPHLFKQGPSSPGAGDGGARRGITGDPAERVRQAEASGDVKESVAAKIATLDR